MNDLKLIALDAEDLAVLSAHLQDAVLRVADMTYLRGEHRFAAVVNRFDWAAALTPALAAGERKPRQQRRRAAVRIERVIGAQLLGLDVKARDRVLSLLAIQFESTVLPAGFVTLQFAGGAAVRLEVECIEAELRDLGAVWSTRSMPDHDTADGEDDASPKGGV